MGGSLPAVAVVMSTYNGARYLREQIESILSQEGVSVSLFVRDDGSRDATLDVLPQGRALLEHVAIHETDETD